MGGALAKTAYFWLVCTAALSSSAAAQAPCSGSEPYIHVSPSEHALYLCEAGQARATYPVSLGEKGLGKRREGDGRTPLGRYPLSSPRPSSAYRWFLEIGYPTPAQRAQGYTGSSIGIHGPPRELLQLELTPSAGVLAMDWTRGCIAVGSDDAISAIVAWVKRTHAASVLIE